MTDDTIKGAPPEGESIVTKEGGITYHRLAVPDNTYCFFVHVEPETNRIIFDVADLVTEELQDTYASDLMMGIINDLSGSIQKVVETYSEDLDIPGKEAYNGTDATNDFSTHTDNYANAIQHNIQDEHSKMSFDLPEGSKVIPFNTSKKLH